MDAAALRAHLYPWETRPAHVLEFLRRLRRTLTPKGAWAKGAVWSRNRDGGVCYSFTDEGIYAWTFFDACQDAAQADVDAQIAAQELLQAVLGPPLLSTWLDEPATSQGDVLALVDRAMIRASVLAKEGKAA